MSNMILCQDLIAPAVRTTPRVPFFPPEGKSHWSGLKDSDRFIYCSSSSVDCDTAKVRLVTSTCRTSLG